MSNKNKAQAPELPQLPGIASGVSTAIESAAQAAQAEPGNAAGVDDATKESEVVTSTPFMAIVEAPLASIDPDAFIPVRERLEAKAMSRKQATALRRLHRGLEDRGEKLEDGTPITRPAQAVRWLLEQIFNAST